MSQTDPAKHTNIFRAIAKKRWYDANSGTISSFAFKVRSRETGLSVLKAVGCSRADCLAGLNHCFGEFLLETNRVRALGLRVVDDEPEDPGFHENNAEIIGIPIEPATVEEKLRVEDLASDLAELSSLYYDRYKCYS